MATTNANENTQQVKTCNCGAGDKNFWNTKVPESSDKPLQKCPNCQSIKSGWLFISSKGIGWTSWKKRWFVLTNTSLVFYRFDPNSLPQKGSENPTLGGIDLNNSGSVDVKEDKKLLTVFFPDGRDGRTFTLKGETSDELQEWKIALENALAQAPSAGLAVGQNGILHNELADSVEPSFENGSDTRPVNSMVVGRPVLLALEDVDGSPAFLEKALRFIEDYGIKVEGILRQSADVELVLRRVQEYEQGKDEFSVDEDGHVIGDCIKYVLREMPSSPVPASCCTALVEAYRTDRGNRINAIRQAISETFPEPNLRLLQRILKMMLTVESHKSENRMSVSALAACMAPLLLRPLLAGDCEFEDNFNMAGDGSLQLLKAAAAANHAQAIVIIMLEEYDRIFDDELLQDGSFSSEIYSESEEDYIEDDESSNNDMLEDDGSRDSESDLDADMEDDLDHSRSGTVSGGSSYVESYLSDNQEDHSTYSSSSGDNEDAGATEIQSDSAPLEENGVSQDENSDSTASPSDEASPMQQSFSHASSGRTVKSVNKTNKSTASMRKPTKWGRTSARKNLPMEPDGYSSDDENAIQRLETAKSDLQAKIAKEVQSNAVLQASLVKRKEALYERRSALEKEVERLREQLQKERDMKESLESGLMSIQPAHAPIKPPTDTKTRADLEEINIAEADIINLKQKATGLRSHLSHQVQTSYEPLCTSCKHVLHEKEKGQQKNVASTPLHENEHSSANDTISSPTSSEDVKTKFKDASLSPKDQHGKKKQSKKTKDKSTPSDSKSMPSKEEQAAVVANAPHNSTARAQNSMYETEQENRRSHTKDSLHSEDKKHSQKFLRGEEGGTVYNDSTSKKSITKGENPKYGGDTDMESSKTQNQNSHTLADAQYSNMQPREASNQSKSKYKDASSTEELTGLALNLSSKKSSVRGEKLKKESKDSASSLNKRLSPKQQSSNSDDAPAGSSNVSKKSFRSEDLPPSSSSAISRLTNRLHFLKERRLQLANELQNLDTTQTSSGPQPPRRQPPRTYSK